MTPMNVIRVAAPATATASVIIVHGLGDSGAGWTFMSDAFHSSAEYQHVNFVFPSAAQRPIYIMGNQKTPAWFNIFEFGNPKAEQDNDGFWQSCEAIEELVQAEIDRGIPPERIAVGGFSQGAVVSLGLACSSKQKLAGFLCMSGIFAMTKDLKSHINDLNKDTPIFHGHGDVDPVFNIAYARDTAKLFKGDLGFTDYEFHEYVGMAHSTCPEEMRDIGQFIKKVLPPK